MKIIKYLMISCILIITACSVHTTSHSGKVPPGQAKKMSGSKSAKAYSPGQSKKR